MKNSCSGIQKRVSTDPLEVAAWKSVNLDGLGCLTPIFARLGVIVPGSSRLFRLDEYLEGQHFFRRFRTDGVGRICLR